MRILIDLQGAQSESRYRGIGRYSLSLAKSIARNANEHDIWLALNGNFPESIQDIRDIFSEFIPPDHIKVFEAIPSVAESIPENSWRARASEMIREAFLNSINPDVCLVSSLFEGYVDDAVTSVGVLPDGISTAVILYDLIPLLNQESYLPTDIQRDYYYRKVESLKNADLLLAISDSSRNEAIDAIQFPDQSVINISTAVDERFHPIDLTADEVSALKLRYNIQKEMVMCAPGGDDPRKNLEKLIIAYAMMPREVRLEHQLVIVGNISEGVRGLLDATRIKAPLDEDELVLTGYVTDEDLISLYNMAKIFVFPSKHEGFGLPVLEAMSCGVATIGSNTSSIPEVIGWEDALFDPHDESAISDRLLRALNDEAFRGELVRRGLDQSRQFSWDVSAKKAITALENWQGAEANILPSAKNLPRLAFVTPLPPERSGIADYSADLIPELSRYYDIEVIIAQSDVEDTWINSNCTIRTVDWFRENSGNYDRVLYQFGNSHFHQHMFDLLQRIPGVVVLHDFFLSDVLAYMDTAAGFTGGWLTELYHSHGYHALSQWCNSKDPSEVIGRYPCNLSVLQNAIGIIVHSEHSCDLAKEWYDMLPVEEWSVIPLLRKPALDINKSEARKALGLSDDDFVVCSFGLIYPHKLNHRLVDAWICSALSIDENSVLVFVGDNPGGDYGDCLLSKIQESGLENRVRISGWVDNETYNRYLAAADLAVQLRTKSRGETSASVLDCMNYGLATIVNANGGMSLLSDDLVWKMPDEFSDDELVEALETFRKDAALRHDLGTAAQKCVHSVNSPKSCSALYMETIESSYPRSVNNTNFLIQALADVIPVQSQDADLHQIASSVALSLPLCAGSKQLFVDVSALVFTDLKTGIQRVVRSILIELLQNPPPGYRVEPVYAHTSHGYRYARQFTQQFLGLSGCHMPDDPIDFQSEDIFLGLDLHPQIVPLKKEFYLKLRSYGVSVYFIIYDLLPILLPKAFPREANEQHLCWLEEVVQNDGAICISKAVADELSEWASLSDLVNPHGFKIDWFHLGSDIDSSVPTKGLPDNAGELLAVLNCRPSFIMVGTLEPRKGHAQTLAAFDELWSRDVDVNLVIVGKQGWLVDELVDDILSHDKYEKRLFWLEGISDEYLEKLYAACTCLIAASEGEGFGLPIIEAARHGLPVIARDIPVFHEVAGVHAYYFDGLLACNIAESVNKWLSLYNNAQHPMPGDIQLLSWHESVMQLLRVVIPEQTNR